MEKNGKYKTKFPLSIILDEKIWEFVADYGKANFAIVRPSRTVNSILAEYYEEGKKANVDYIAKFPFSGNKKRTTLTLDTDIVNWIKSQKRETNAEFIAQILVDKYFQNKE